MNFLKHIANGIITIFTWGKARTTRKPIPTVAEMMREDFEKVGEDLKKAMGEFDSSRSDKK